MRTDARRMNREIDKSLLLRNGSRAITAVYGISIALVFYVALVKTSFLVLVPVALLGGIGGLFLITAKEWNVYFILTAFVLIAEFEAGIQPQEVIYAAGLLGFFIVWYSNHLIIQRRKLLTNSTDKVIFLFVMFAFASASWSYLLGSGLSDIVNECVVMMMFGFYYPVKHTVADTDKAATRLIYVVCWIGFFVFVRNIFHYQQGLANADQLYQIASGRVSTNEALQLFPAIGALVGLVYSASRKQFLLTGFAFSCFFTGLVITQSRGYWLAFVVASVALFVIANRQIRYKMLSLALAGGLVIALAGYLFSPTIAILILEGLIDRVASLGKAFTGDISFVNRVYDSKTVWSYITHNPILGYGIGASYSYFNLIDDATRNWAFVHNGYIGVWFKYGIVGLASILYVWLRSIRSGIRHFRSQQLSVTSLLVLISTLCLIALAVVANTSNPFLKEDTTMMFALLTGFISGASDRAVHDAVE